MSYWTYTDLFEEPGPPPTPFHGGFGLLNREGIPKPAYCAYKYLHAVSGNEILKKFVNAMSRICPRFPTYGNVDRGWRRNVT
jgi:xylan 1,4-beta-xylosidase